MNRNLLILLLCSFSFVTEAQDFRWLRYETNPNTSGIPNHAFKMLNHRGELISFRKPYNFKQQTQYIDPSKSQVIDKFDANSDYWRVVNWTHPNGIQFDSFRLDIDVYHLWGTDDGYYLFGGAVREDEDIYLFDNKLDSTDIGFYLVKVDTAFKFQSSTFLPCSYLYSFSGGNSAVREFENHIDAYTWVSRNQTIIIGNDTIEQIPGINEFHNFYRIRFYKDGSSPRYETLRTMRNEFGFINRLNGFQQRPRSPILILQNQELPTRDFYVVRTNTDEFEIDSGSTNLNFMDYRYDSIKNRTLLLMGKRVNELSPTWGGVQIPVQSIDDRIFILDLKEDLSVNLFSEFHLGSDFAMLHDISKDRLSVITATSYSVRQYGDTIFRKSYFQLYSQFLNVIVDSLGEIETVTEGPITCQFTFEDWFSVKSRDESVLILGNPMRFVSDSSDQFNFDCIQSGCAVSDIPFGKKAEPIDNFSFSPIYCSSAQVTWTNNNSDHYTLLVSTQPLPKLPRDGENYAYSPDYLSAPFLDPDDETRILYQGPDTNITISNLPSSETFFFFLIPGTGAAGKTTYNNFDIVNFTYRSFEPANPNAIELSVDSFKIICPGDSLEVQAKASNFLRWNDGVRIPKRTITDNQSLFAYAYDSSSCVVRSKSLWVTRINNPQIVEVVTRSIVPPSVQVIAYPYPDTLYGCANDGIWISPDYIQPAFGAHSFVSEDSLHLTESGYYRIKKQDTYGCIGEVGFQVELLTNELSLNLDTVYTEGELKEIPLLQSNLDSFHWRIAEQSIEFPFTLEKSGYLIVEGYSSENVFAEFPTDTVESCGLIRDSLFLQLGTKPLTVPNAFTPNGDGLNDLWWPKLSGAYEYKVFDRWGELLFVGNEESRWDGYRQGSFLPSGYYYYVIETEYQRKLTGHIHLIR